MKKYISFSGGVESSAMCVLFGDKADAIFADAGWEHKQIYDRIDLVEKRVREIHGNDFKVHRIKADASHEGVKIDSLKDYIRASKFYPSQMARYCTRMFKIEPIDQFIQDEGEVELMIGLNYDERDRTGNHGLLENVTYSYPLIDNNITRKACIKILEHAGLVPSFPPYMQRGGCVGCFYKSKKEFYAMAQLSPDEFKEVEDIEREIQDVRGKFYSIRKNIPSMKALRELAETSMFDAEEMYGEYDLPETPCGVFCNR
jgi:hypothetical protein